MAPTIPIEYGGQRESKTCSQRSSVIMGKTRKFSKGYSSGFVPDYRHVVDTMAESEWVGSSGRVDTEMTASEDSYVSKRKCISLNVDAHNHFGAPYQVLSFLKMSYNQKKDLEMRLKSELEQVRLIQKKFAYINSNFAVLSPSSHTHRCSDGLKRPPVENFQRSVDVSTLHRKKRGHPSWNGPCTKPKTGRIGSVKQPVPQCTPNSMLMKQCYNLLNQLMSQQHGWVFNTPVDVIALNIPDYFNVIKHPMDLGTVKRKLSSNEYSSPLDFAADVRLTFSNAVTYNPRGNDVHFMAEMLSKYFEVRWKSIEKKVSVIIDAPLPSTLSVDVEAEIPHVRPPFRNVTPVDNMINQEPMKCVMTAAEKHKLSTELEAQLADLPENMIDFLKNQSYSASQIDEEEIEIDIDMLSDDTLFALRKLLDDYLLDKQKKQGRTEPCEMELLDESGFSNSSARQRKGNDPADENVDIGGNDPPTSSYPPVEIKKNTALRNNKRSSSSSQSGSSPSDSDSRSSDSDSGGAKAEVPTISMEGKSGGSGENTEQKRDLGDPDIGNYLLNSCDEVDEHNSQDYPVAIEDGGCQEEGENTLLGRQVSPDKLYRAALLRSRFADTILKAQEKVLEKVEKQDPDKLRLQREELEKRRKEEKARLLSEAKAAEEARRKAETEAKAKAKRRRELEREAARLALQKMEKTVEINENFQFMDDIEILSGAPPEQLQCFLDDSTTPDHSQGGVGSFKFQRSSNPLEQLGLYIKVDDEYEDEGVFNIQS